MTDAHYQTARALAVDYVSKNAKGGHWEWDELIQAGLANLAMAYHKYDEERATFSTFAYIYIRGGVEDRIRKDTGLKKNKNYCRKPSYVSESINIDPESKFATSDTKTLVEEMYAVCDVEERINKKDEERMLCKLIAASGLSEAEEEALWAWTEYGTMAKIAKRDGVTAGAVTQRATIARNKLKQKAKQLNLTR